MGTRSNIGIINEDGSVTAIYCHWDGFLSYNGKILLNHYTTADIVNQLSTLLNTFFEDKEKCTCKHCGTVMQKPVLNS